MWEGHCCLHGPSHQGSHPRLSPWLRPSANVSRLEAPFCCFMARARATLNEQCQPSEGEALLNWSNGVEASPPVIGDNLRTTRDTPAFAYRDVREFRTHDTRKEGLLSAPASSRHALLVSQAPYAIKAIGEAAIVAIDRRKEPESITREPIRRHTAAPPERANQTTRCRRANNQTTRRTHTQVQCNDEDRIDPRRARDGAPPASGQRCRSVPRAPRAAPRMAISALLFDCDGVIADTEPDGHRPAFNAAFKEKGFADVWTKEHYGELLETGGGKERMTAHWNEVGWPSGYDSPRASRPSSRNYT